MSGGKWQNRERQLCPVPRSTAPSKDASAPWRFGGTRGAMPANFPVGPAHLVNSCGENVANGEGRPYGATTRRKTFGGGGKCDWRHLLRAAHRPVDECAVDGHRAKRVSAQGNSLL